MELFLRAPAHNIQGSFAVELLGNEVRLFRETIKSFPDRVFHDENHTSSRNLLAGGQILAKPWQTCSHRPFVIRDEGRPRVGTSGLPFTMREAPGVRANTRRLGSVRLLLRAVALGAAALGPAALGPAALGAALMALGAAVMTTARSNPLLQSLQLEIQVFHMLLLTVVWFCLLFLCSTSMLQICNTHVLQS